MTVQAVEVEGTKRSRHLEALGYTHVFTYEDGKQDWINAGLRVERGLSDSTASEIFNPARNV